MLLKGLFYFILVPALLPVVLVLIYVLGKDKTEREPFWAVFLTLILGALFALPDIPLESFADSFISSMFAGYTPVKLALIKNIFGVALIEELSKWLVIMVFVWKLRDFDYRYDGIVYCVCASLGFAGLENILYVVGYGPSVSVGRALFSIPGHAAFGVFMGYHMSRAKHWQLRGNGFLKFFCLLFSIAVPTLIHGAYDFLLTPAAQESQFSGSFMGYVIVLDIITWLIIRHEFKTDRPL